MAINNMWHGVLIMAEIVNQWRNGVSYNQSAGSYHISGVINQRGGGVMAYQ
jgi:trehalose/maltose hydrolase-like predicted phosphorylase